MLGIVSINIIWYVTLFWTIQLLAIVVYRRRRRPSADRRTVWAGAGSLALLALGTLVGLSIPMLTPMWTGASSYFFLQDALWDYRETRTGPLAEFPQNEQLQSLQKKIESLDLHGLEKVDLGNVSGDPGRAVMRIVIDEEDWGIVLSGRPFWLWPPVHWRITQVVDHVE